MDKTLGIHIAHLEEKLRDLNKELMDEARTRAEHNRLESEIRAAELALVYYRKALELEQQLTTES
jgi:Skp family chaperone for outer membrane proteins